MSVVVTHLHPGLILAAESRSAVPQGFRSGRLLAMSANVKQKLITDGIYYGPKKFILHDPNEELLIRQKTTFYYKFKIRIIQCQFSEHVDLMNSCP